MAGIDFFMGGNSPTGFHTYYEELAIPQVGYHSYLIKGGAGTGKSSFMRRMLHHVNTPFVEQIHCSSDPNSLDGILTDKARKSMVDATFPHIIEPLFPASFQTVINLCEYLDEQKMKPRLEQIVALQTQNSACHKRCCELLKSAKFLLDANANIFDKATNIDKLNSYISRACKKYFPQKAQKNPIEHKRLLSAITNQGILCYEKTPLAMATNIVVFSDEYGTIASKILQEFKKVLLEKGYEIYCCYCPLDQEKKVEHIFIPELSLAFLNKTSYRKFDDIKNYVLVNCTRFLDLPQISQQKQKIKLYKNLAFSIISDGVNELKKAKIIHDDLEKQYSDAVDFVKVNEKADQICTDFSCKE